MSGHKSPLRDRLLSNSPDPMKSLIIHESGMAWNSPPSSSNDTASTPNSITSPLRIAKRESPRLGVARRSSSSYKHVRNNNLVSKSPFKSQIPTPSTPSSRFSTPVTFPASPRRVSGEKRPRPISMHEQAENENERPFAYKRERRQSKGYQGLIQKEPVTKSPFKQRTSTEDHPLPPVPPLTRMPIPSFAPPSASRIPTPRSSNPSPTRSSLVSRRMHGPRLSGKRERRKTVTFDERCNVVEFDREEGESDDPFESADEDDYGDADPFFQGLASPSIPTDDHPQLLMEDSSYESVELSDTEVGGEAPPFMRLDPDSSITGLVDEMFASNPAHADSQTTTPPRRSDIPTDLETVDGVPFGRSHHSERFIEYQYQYQHQSPQPAPSYPFNLNLPTHALPQGPPATPPRRATLNVSSPPLGRSTHTERVRAAREEEVGESVDVDMLPVSPSPRKGNAAFGVQTEEDRLIPRFEVPVSSSPQRQPESEEPGLDPFAVPRLTNETPDETLPSQAEESYQEVDSLDPANLSIGHSEVSLSTLAGLHHESEEEVLETPQNAFFTMDRPALRVADSHPDMTTQNDDPPPRAQEAEGPHPTDQEIPTPWIVQKGDAKTPEDTHSPIPSRVTTPVLPSPSPLRASGSNQSLSGGVRPRISREDVKRRLLRRRSFGSPTPGTGSPSFSEQEDNGDNRSFQENRAEEENVVENSQIRIEEEEKVRELAVQEEEKDKDRMSVMTMMTDISAEMATIERAEKMTLSAGGLLRRESEEFGLLGAGDQLMVDFGSRFGLGLGIGNIGGSAGSRESMGVLKTGSEIKAGSVASGGSGSSAVRMGDVDVDMDMKSALDRLMDDVAGTRADDSMIIDEGDSYDRRSSPPTAGLVSRVMERAATDSALLGSGGGNGFMSRNVSESSSMVIPPPLPPKDNIKSREALILEKRREARRIEEETMGYDAPPPTASRQHLGVGRPSRRRSMSTGDVEELGGAAKKRANALLDVDVGAETEEDPFVDSIERELKMKLAGGTVKKKSRYQIREHEGTIYASSDADRVSHMAGPGDMNTGKAWRTVRRPSDMNEYSKQIKEYRLQEKPGKAYGKVFVKVLGVRGLHLPLPEQTTALTCTLNNGIHFVTTPECKLGRDSRIEQEFELIEHSKLEFTLTLKVRRDPHIITQFKALALIPPPAPPPVVLTSSKGGMRSFFSSSPKKPKEKPVAPPPPPPAQRLTENLARYLKSDGTLARAFISFKEIAHRCDTRLFETSYPLIGQRVELGNKFSTLQVGEIVLQMFRLPPLPGIVPEQLPQSLEECHRGLRHINWHKVTYFEGTLTQSGGDCSTWRRRQLRVIGANLVAFNDVTKKATATIDLKKAIAVEDDQEARNNIMSPASGMTARSSRYADEYDGLYGVERSFRLIFPQNQEIIFFADTDEEKSRWLEVLRALVGHIPPHPLWAELLWQRQDELAKRVQSAASLSQTQAIPRALSPAGRHYHR